MPYVRRISTKVLHTKFYTKATCDFFANVIEQQQICLGILTNSSLERALFWLSIGGLSILSGKIFREISYAQSMQFYALPPVSSRTNVIYYLEKKQSVRKKSVPHERQSHERYPLT